MSQPFRRSTLVAVVVVSAISLGVAVFASLFGESPVASQSGANTFSRSALGHHAFVKWLRTLEIPVVVSQSSSADRAGGSAVLLVLEPTVTDDDHSRAELNALIDGPERVLLVLPKWEGYAHAPNSRWIESAALRNPVEVDRIVHQLDENAAVRRLTSAGDVTWDSGSFHHAPTLLFPQVIVSAEITPLIATDEGILLGKVEWTEGQVFVLADPDLLSNHGLGRGQNAALALEVLDNLRAEGDSVVVDETLHGFTREPNPFRALFDVPLVFATLTAFVAAFLLLWAALRRFGAPLASPPPFEPGKGSLIRNTAALLLLGRHNRETLRRYFRDTLFYLRRKLHAPVDNTEDDMRAWADRVGLARGLGLRLGDVETRIDAACRRQRVSDILAAAQDVYRYRQEMIRGPSDRSQR